jgi:hypothetical protein
LARRTRILESLQIWPARSELNDIAGTRRGLILAPLLGLDFARAPRAREVKAVG